jgi:hypothetical protein
MNTKIIPNCNCGVPAIREIAQTGKRLPFYKCGLVGQDGRKVCDFWMMEFVWMKQLKEAQENKSPLAATNVIVPMYPSEPRAPLAQIPKPVDTKINKPTGDSKLIMQKLKNIDETLQKLFQAVTGVSVTLANVNATVDYLYQSASSPRCERNDDEDETNGIDEEMV